MNKTVPSRSSQLREIDDHRQREPVQCPISLEGGREGRREGEALGEGFSDEQQFT